MNLAMLYNRDNNRPELPDPEEFAGLPSGRRGEISRKTLGKAKRTRKVLVGYRPGYATPRRMIKSTYGPHPRYLYPFFDKFLTDFKSYFPQFLDIVKNRYPEAFSRWYMSLPSESTHLLSNDMQRAAQGKSSLVMLLQNPTHPF
jgi:hypothetical protein